ncbi:hypothetical protein QYM36_020082, partial [Artemia franciscana]
MAGGQADSFWGANDDSVASKAGPGAGTVNSVVWAKPKARVVVNEEPETGLLEMALIGLLYCVNRDIVNLQKKRGLGSDTSEALREEYFNKAVGRLGYKDTLPNLDQSQQVYNSCRIQKTYPVEPIVGETLTQCILLQSWVDDVTIDAREEA